MHIRGKKLILLVCMVLYSASMFGQRRLTYTIEASGLVNWFGINTRSAEYNTRWEKVDLTFKPKLGYSVGLGLDYAFNEKLNVFGKLRYQQWGGFIHVIRPGGTYPVDFDINYKSFNIPFGISYTLKETPRFKYALKAGGGFDNSFKLNYTVTTKYGTGPEQVGNITIHTAYLLLGFDWGIRVSNSITGFMSIEVNNDMLLNPNRTQNFQGFYNQMVIPLSYNMVMVSVGVKL